MPPRIGLLRGPDLWVELVFAAIIVIACLIVYFRTKELFNLSSHKGIKYFRNTFLFFSIAYTVRYLMRLFVVSFDIGFPPSQVTGLFFLIVIAFFSYATTMASFYLVLSISWKKLNGTWLTKPWTLNTIAIVIAIITIPLRNPILLLSIQTGLIIYAVIESTTIKKKSQFHIIYILLFIFYFLTIIQTSLPRFLITIQTIIYLISAGIFITIAYKVYEKTKPKK